MKGYTIAMDNIGKLTIAEQPNIQYDIRIAAALGKSPEEYRRWMCNTIGAIHDIKTNALLFNYKTQAEHGMVMVQNEINAHLIQYQRQQQYAPQPVIQPIRNQNIQSQQPQPANKLSWFERNKSIGYIILCLASAIFSHYILTLHH